MVTSGNVFGAEGCTVSQISSLRNVPAEAEILAGYTRSALITVQGNIHICMYVCVCVRERVRAKRRLRHTTVRKKSLWAFGCSTGEDKTL